jgi:hypothetical protein
VPRTTARTWLGGGAEGQGDGIGGELKARRDGGIAEEREARDDAQAVGRDGLGDGELQAARVEGDFGDGDAGGGRGEFEVERRGIEGGELLRDGDELAGDGGVLAREKFGDGERAGVFAVAGREINGAVGIEGNAGDAGGELGEFELLLVRDQRGVEVAENFFGAAARREHGGDGEMRAGDADLARIELAGGERPRIEAHVDGARGDDGLGERGEGQAGVFDEDAAGGIERGAAKGGADTGGGEAVFERA